MNEGDGNLACGVGAQQMAQELEDGERQGSGQDLPRRLPQPIFQRRYLSLDRGKDRGERCEDEAPGGDGGELNDGQGSRLGERIEDRLGRGIRKGRRQVPGDA